MPPLPSGITTKSALGRCHRARGHRRFAAAAGDLLHPRSMAIPELPADALAELDEFSEHFLGT
jgi:hypothetical protein